MKTTPRPAGAAREHRPDRRADPGRHADPAPDRHLAGSATPRSARRFLADLRHAAHDVGFFYVAGHGIPPEVTDGVLDAARRFFALPLRGPARDRERQLAAVPRLQPGRHRAHGRRCRPARPDRRRRRSGRRSTDVPADKPYLRPDRPQPVAAGGARPPGRPCSRWLAEADRVSREVLRALAAALGQPETYFDRWFDDEAHTHVKVAHYPGREQVGVGPGRRRAQGLRLAGPPAAGRPRRPAGRGQGRQLDRRRPDARGVRVQHRRDARGRHPGLPARHPAPCREPARAPRPVQHPGLPRAAPGRRRRSRCSSRPNWRRRRAASRTTRDNPILAEYGAKPAARMAAQPSRGSPSAGGRTARPVGRG